MEPFLFNKSGFDVNQLELDFINFKYGWNKDHFSLLMC
jgi:hypothetical protein